MIRIQAPSRLHFGLLSLTAEEHWRNRDGADVVAARRFGGVGLMVQAPGIRVSVQAATVWSASGPRQERASRAAQRVAAALGDIEPQHIDTEECAPEHAGLGTGTQLEMAVGRAVAIACGRSNLDAVELARILGRGQRSALGIHGFARGGFLVDGGKGAKSTVAPLVARCDFPADWRIVLIVPAWAQGLHGSRERQAFQQLLDQGSTPATTDLLCRLALLGMLPALAERDLSAFGEALYDFNARVGAAFAPVQGGVYAHPRLAELVTFIRQQGVAGVGQSSWGAAIFAVVADDDSAAELARRLRERFGLTAAEVICTSASNTGAVVMPAQSAGSL